MLVKVVFIFSVLALYAIYDGYLRVLQVLGRLGREAPRQTPGSGNALLVTILITVHNEQATIAGRIANLLDQDYPRERLEILIASDGSTDGTDERVREFQDRGVRLFRAAEQLGKTGTQNLAIRQAKGEIIVFSDADSRFDRSFVSRIAAAFTDSRVGAADGHLLFAVDHASRIGQSQGSYWRYELRVREAESRLGWLAVASGACLAVRRSLFRDMDPSIGEDCIVPLDVVAQGYRVVHVSDAIAYDRIEAEEGREFRVRVRMTLRNWQGTWSRPALLNPLQHPGIAFSLWFHKVLRWLSPAFLIALFVSGNLWLATDGVGGLLAATAVDGLVLLSLIGWWGHRAGLRIPLAGVLYSFALANAAFFVGVTRALSGHTIRVYRKP